MKRGSVSKQIPPSIFHIIADFSSLTAERLSLIDEHLCLQENISNRDQKTLVHT